MIWLFSEADITIFSTIQTHLSCHFHLVFYSLDLRRNGSSSQVINQAQNLLEKASWDRNLCQLESDIAAMTNDLGPNLHRTCVDAPRNASFFFGQVLALWSVADGLCHVKYIRTHKENIKFN